jgi:plasmid stabilization system protein ParE
MTLAGSDARVSFLRGCHLGNTRPPPHLLAHATLDEAFRFLVEETHVASLHAATDAARTFTAIEQFPERHHVVRGVTLRALVQRFPYCVYYIVDADLIGVTAVMHARRDPQRWQERGDAGHTRISSIELQF